MFEDDMNSIMAIQVLLNDCIYVVKTVYKITLNIQERY